MTSSSTISRTAPSTVVATSIATSQLSVQTRGKGFVDLTRDVEKFLSEANAKQGALTIQENADPSVLVDLGTALSHLAPENAGWTHDTEGPDDMPAHVKTMLTSVSLQIPVVNGEMVLGTWQAIYLIEHRSRPHRREVVAQFVGSTK
jgi:secondary thiamine-phosphate synthase enzyme